MVEASLGCVYPNTRLFWCVYCIVCRRARALYPCLAEDENELSFSVDDVLHDGR